MKKCTQCENLRLRIKHLEDRLFMLESKPTLQTGFSPIDAISYKEFHPYTDLLLHDMGAALDDNYTEGNATCSGVAP